LHRLRDLAVGPLAVVGDGDRVDPGDVDRLLEPTDPGTVVVALFEPSSSKIRALGEPVGLAVWSFPPIESRGDGSPGVGQPA